MSVDPASAYPWVWPRLHEAQRAVLLDVLVHGSRSRADLARRTGLSRASLMRLTRDLVDLGLVSEGETSRVAGRGRPSETLHLVPGAAHFAGVKLTGDSLYAAVTDLHANVLQTEEHMLGSRSVEDVVTLIAQVVTRFRQAHPRLAAIGVCLAGDVQEVGGKAVVLGSHFLGWDEAPLESLVSAATGLPTAISNDVQALTVAHHWFGAGVGCRSLAVIGLGAGIGVGLVVNDELIRGARGHPGKIGHIFVTEDGPGCDVGHPGCVSAWVTIPSLTRNAGTATLEEAFERAAAGDARAGAAVAAAAFALGVAIAEVANIADPEKVVVTGEGLAIAREARSALDAGLAARLDPVAEPVVVDINDFDFADYAWAAAISAIRLVV